MTSWIERVFEPATPETSTHQYENDYYSVKKGQESEFWEYVCEKHPVIVETTRDRRLQFDLALTFDRARTSIDRDSINMLVTSIDRYVTRVVSTIQQMMEQHFVLSIRESERIACYLRREDKTSLILTKRSLKFTGRIVFPYARMTAQQHDAFHEMIMYELQRSGDLPTEYLSAHPINGLDTTLPNPSTMNDPLQAPFVIQRIYTRQGRELPSLDEVFDPRFHSAEIDVSMINNHDTKFWLPVFFSNEYYLTLMEPKQSMLDETKRLQENEIEELDETTDATTLNDFERVSRFLDLLSEERANAYWSWIDVGYAIFSLDLDDTGLELWKTFTRRGTMFTADNCSEQWTQMDETSFVTVETIEYFASLDNPERYRVYKNQEIEDALCNAIDIREDVAIARAFKTCFPFQFICANYQHGEWYQYSRHRWNRTDGRYSIKKQLITSFQFELDKMQKNIATKKVASQDREFNKKCQRNLDNIGKLSRSLQKERTLNCISETLKMFYFHGDFSSIHDLNPYLLTTGSGVIDLRGKKAVVRQGKPEDFITLYTRHSYPMNFTWETKQVQATLKYLHQIFRQKDLFEFFLRFLASGLVGDNLEKIFPIFTGEGGNSKSMLIKLIEMAFGKYVRKIPVSLLTDDQTSADSATPTLVSSRGAKWVIFDEAGKKDLQSNTMKRITGRDSQYVRDLFQRGSNLIEMPITYTPIIHANEIPKIPDCQQAVWDRVLIVPFLSTWSKDAPKDEEEQMRQGHFAMDPNFDQYFSSMAPALIWICVQKYADYVSIGLNPPAVARQATEDFRIHNNHYVQFTRECITTVKTDDGLRDTNAQVNLDTLFNRFKIWWGNQGFQNRVPTKLDFKKNIETTWRSKADGDNRWYGVRLNDQSDALDAILTI